MFYYKCIICNKKHTKFLSIEDDLGQKLRLYKFPYKLKEFETLSYKTFLCSNCGSSDKDRLYKMYFEKHVPNIPKIKIIDFAPSVPFQKYLLSRDEIVYRSADLYMNNVDDNIDITDMKIYKNESFDFFVCSHILEHVTDDIRAIKELKRILKEGGRGILMTPIINKEGVFDEDIKESNINERWRRFAQDDHLRLYEKIIFKKRVSEAGFRLEEYGFMKLGFWNFIKNGIRLRSKLYIVTKEK